MPRILMTETYSCGEGTFRRGKAYDVTDERARMLTGRGSAQYQTAAKPAAPETDEANPQDVTPSAGGGETGSASRIEDQAAAKPAPAATNGRRRSQPAAKPKS